MKNSKLLFLITILIIGIYSCSNDDEIEIISNDMIVGIWKPSVEIYFMPNGTQISQDFNDCVKTNTLNFKGNGNFESTTYDQDANGNCVETSDHSQIIEARWEKLRDMKYRISTKIKINNQTQTTVLEPDAIIFQDMNTIRISYDETQYYQGVKIERIYLEYIRIE